MLSPRWKTAAKRRCTVNGVVAILLAVKAVVVAYNIYEYPTKRCYDSGHHAWRVRSAGLEAERMAYNSPLYYLPALLWVDPSPFVGDVDRRQVRKLPKKDWAALKKLRRFNLLYIIGGLAIWIYRIFPLLLPSRRLWLVASMAILAMPGYAKIAVMAHPDVLLFLMAGLTFFFTLRWLPAQPRFRDHLLLALLAGLTGACRPFAVVPMLACWFLNVAGLVQRYFTTSNQRPSGSKIAALVAKVGAVTLITASLSSGWWVYRYHQTGEVMDAYDHSYVDPYQPLKEDFDFLHYYTSFYFGSLLDVPSRADVPQRPGLHAKGNSFWTQLFSDFWGDHFLSFSGREFGSDGKLWVKRVLFSVALPLTLLLWVGFLTGAVRTATAAVRARGLWHPLLFCVAIFAGGFLLFVVWQGTAGLLPGKNSSIKFMYINWALPFGVAVAATQASSGRWFWALFALELLVALAALPMSLHWP